MTERGNWLTFFAGVRTLHGIWGDLADGQGNPFPSFQHLLTEPLRFGLGVDIKKLEQLCQIFGGPDDEVWLREVLKVQGKDFRDNVTEVEVSEAKRGNRRSYTLDRLHRQFPELYDRVKAGELSANAAAIEAGFRKKLTRVERMQRDWNNATQEERKEFLASLE